MANEPKRIKWLLEGEVAQDRHGPHHRKGNDVLGDRMIAIRTEDPVFIAAIERVRDYQAIREVSTGYSREEALDPNTGKVKK